MNTPTLSPAQPATTGLPAIDLTPRRLADDVFQSAEQAVLVEGQADAFANTLPPVAASDVVRQGTRRGFSFANAVQAHVAARPCQSALLAAAAGALVAVVLRSQLRGRVQLSRSSWRR